MSDPEQSVREKLKTEILPASWPELLYQFARGALFLVDPAFDLLDVAEVLARDDSARVRELLVEGGLRRASDDDARAFQARIDTRFQFVIVQPWVVAQQLAAPT